MQISSIRRWTRPLNLNTPATGAWQPLGFVLLAVVLGVLLIQVPTLAALDLLARTAALVLILIEPLFGLGLALLLGPLGALENISQGEVLLDSGQLWLLVTLLVWLARGLRRRRLVLPHTYLSAPLGLFLLVTAVSLIDAPSLSFGLKELVKWLEIGAIMLLVVDMVGEKMRVGQKEGQIRPWVWILVMLLLAGVSQAAVGVWQFGLRGEGPDHFLVLDRFYRAYGAFEQPNPFAGYVNLTAMLALGAGLGLLALVWRRWRDLKVSIWQSVSLRHWLALIGVGFCALLAGSAVVFSWSRGAWLSLGIATAVLVLFWPRQRWQGMLLLLLAGVLLWGGIQAGAVPPSVTERITNFTEDLRFGDVRGEDINDANYAVLERLAHWQAALNMAQARPWLGVGFGNYEPAYADYALLNWPFPLGHAHNYYLNLLAETGVLGLGAYLLLWTAVFWQTMRLLRRLDWPHRGVALGLLAAWTTLTVHHLVDKLYVNNIYIHLGVMFGLLQLLELQIGDKAFRLQNRD